MPQMPKPGDGSKRPFEIRTFGATLLVIGFICIMGQCVLQGDAPLYTSGIVFMIVGLACNIFAPMGRRGDQ